MFEIWYGYNSLRQVGSYLKCESILKSFQALGFDLELFRENSIKEAFTHIISSER